MGFILRKACNQDELELLALVKRVLQDYGLTINPEVTDKDLRTLEAFYFHSGGWFSVLESNQVIIGSYGLCPLTDTVCELRKMYLLPEFQGKGLGKLLLDNALGKAKELGFTEVRLETNRKLEKAIQLYKKYGFDEYIPDHISDRCDLGMKRLL